LRPAGRQRRDPSGLPTMRKAQPARTAGSDPPRTPPGTKCFASLDIPGPDDGSAPGTPPGGPPRASFGTPSPNWGRSPERRRGDIIVYTTKTTHEKRGETWCVRPQKRGKNTHKGLKLGPFWAPLPGAHPVRFWGGPPPPPIPHCKTGLSLIGPPASPDPPKMAPRGAPLGGGPRRAVWAVGRAAPGGPPGGYPPREGPPDPPRGPLGPTETPPGPPPGAPPGPPQGRSRCW
jgi:hypothetical protein